MVYIRSYPPTPPKPRHVPPARPAPAAGVEISSHIGQRVRHRDYEGRVSAAQHTPGQQCDACEGFCLRDATIDEANTALALASTSRERLLACEALIVASSSEASRLRAAIAKAEGSAS